jgi:hypothetical protein
MRFACTGTDRAEEPVAIDDHTVDLAHRDDIVGATERPHREGESAASRGGRRLGEHLDGVAGPHRPEMLDPYRRTHRRLPLVDEQRSGRQGRRSASQRSWLTSAGRAPSASLSRVQMFMLITTPTISSLSSSSK